MHTGRSRAHSDMAKADGINLCPEGSATFAAFRQAMASGRVGKHVQSHDDEVVIVLEGEAVIYVQGQPHACVKGSAVPLALGQTLEIDNASPTEPVRYLIVKATAKR